jgi:hypothetical protein
VAASGHQDGCRTWLVSAIQGTREGEYPVIGTTSQGPPMFSSMRMKVVEEKIVDGHTAKVLPPGYAQGAYPAKNVSVRS